MKAESWLANALGVYEPVKVPRSACAQTSRILHTVHVAPGTSVKLSVSVAVLPRWFIMSTAFAVADVGFDQYLRRRRRSGALASEKVA